jgi:hypothetical protein
MPRRSHPLFVIVAIAAITVWGGCSGASSSSLLGGSGGKPSGSSSGSGSSGGGSSGSSGTGSSSGSSGSGSSSGSTSSSGTTMDSGVLDSGTTVIDTGTGDEPTPTGPAVLCPMGGSPATCQPGDFCCVTGDAMQGTQMDNCQTPAQSCSGTKVHCAATADCPANQVCCGNQQQVMGVFTYTEVSCAASCASTTQRIFCDPAANDCPQQTPTCGQSQLMPGYNVCQ